MTVAPSPPVLRFGQYQLIPSSCTVWAGDRRVDLSARKFQLALALFTNFGSLASASDLSLIAWGEQHARAPRMMAAHAELLRHLLALDGTLGYELQRTSGHCYRIREFAKH